MTLYLPWQSSSQVCKLQHCQRFTSPLKRHSEQDATHVPRAFEFSVTNYVIVRLPASTVLCLVKKYYGRKSSVGRDVCRLRKAYYGARHEAAVQIDEIVGETVSEADSSDSMDRDHAHHVNKDDDIIRCICGMYKDEGLMIQCEKCMVRTAKFCSSGGNRDHEVDFQKDLCEASILKLCLGKFGIKGITLAFLFLGFCLPLSVPLRSGSTVTACVWKPRWSIIFVSSVTLAQSTEYVTFVNSPPL